MRIDEFDWDNLIILDACRKDLYEEVTEKPVRTRRTVGSNSEEFIEKTFSPKHMDDLKKDFWRDVVVVTANPHYHEPLFEEATGQKPSEVFKEIYTPFTDETYWSDELGTVHPANMLSATQEAIEDHGPDTRFLIHFMQPHAPFIGGWGEPKVENDPERDMNIWDRLEEGEFTDQQVWTAFKQNLETVIKDAEILDTMLLGDTYITADHGNAFGENNEYGHPSNSSNPVLRNVPLDKVNQ